jgi:hypothetical protein
MSTAQSILPVIDDPKPRKWSKAECHQLADSGWFRDQRGELIEGGSSRSATRRSHSIGMRSRAGMLGLRSPIFGWSISSTGNLKLRFHILPWSAH